MRTIDKLAKQIRKGKTNPQNIPAYLGNSSGTVKTGHGSKNYVTLANGEVIEILNRRVPGLAGRQVRIGKDDDYPSQLQVLGFQDVFDDDETLGWPMEHGETHEWDAHDRVAVSGFQFMPLLVGPAESGSFTVQVYEGYLSTPSGFVKVANRTVDISASQPAAGACYVLLRSDASGVVTAKSGSTVDAKELLGADDIPNPDAGYYPIFAVALYDGQERVRCDREINDFVDLRFGGYANASGSYQPLDATLTSISALGTAADRMIYTTGVDTWAETAVTAFGRSLLDDANAGAVLTTLGVTADAQLLLLDADVPRLSTANTWAGAQTIHALAVIPVPNAFNAGIYSALVLGDVVNGETDGALMAVARNNPVNVPFVAFTGYDSNAARVLYFGGGGWDAPDANQIAFYTAAIYNETKNQGLRRLVIMADGRIALGTADPAAKLDIPSSNVTDFPNGFANNLRLSSGAYPAIYFVGTVANKGFVLAHGGDGSIYFDQIVSGAHVRYPILISANGNVLIAGYTAATAGLTVQASASPTANAIETKDSGGSIHNQIRIAHGSNVYETVFNEQGSANLDFRIETDAYDGFYVDASDNAVYVARNVSAKFSLWGVTAIVQPSGANQAAIMNSTGGSYDGTLADVGASYDQAILNNNFTDLYTLLNEMRTVMVNVGLMKGSA
jgi:hypothetical protein